MKKQIRLLIMVTAMVKRAIAVLDYPADIDDFITFALSVWESMRNNPIYAPLALKIAALKTAIDELVLAQTAFHSKPPTGTKEQRDAKLVVVQNKLRGLRGDVQEMADAAPPSEAEAIITGAHMKVKHQGAINKQILTAVSKSTGTVTLTAKGMTGHHANDWQMSDDGTNWAQLTPTLAGHTMVTGLLRGAIKDFRHRYITTDGPTDWDQVDGILVT